MLVVVGWVLAEGLALPEIPRWFDAVGYSAIAFAFTALVGVAIDPPAGLDHILSAAPIVYIGRISYGLYLWHCLVGAATEELLHRASFAPGPSWTVALAALATLLVASLSWFAFERPIQRLKRHFPQIRRRSGPLP